MKGDDNFGGSYNKLCKTKNGNKKDPLSLRSYTFLRAGFTQEGLEYRFVLCVKVMSGWGGGD